MFTHAQQLSGADQNIRRDNVDCDLLEAPKTLRHHVIVDLRTRLLTRSLTSAASIDALTSAINNHAATPEYQKRASMIYAPPLRDSSGTLEMDGGFFLQIATLPRYQVGHPDHIKPSPIQRPRTSGSRRTILKTWHSNMRC
jgi:hypothetical protein